ncbi:MAG: response regulator [Pyrinomonadaceae bacterium]
MNRFSLPKNLLTDENSPSAPPVADDVPLVLLFSKNSESRLLLRTFLKIWKCRVRAASSEADLIRLVKSESPKLILLDMSLAFDEDLALLRRMRESSLCGDIPIVVVSGHARAQDCDSALAFGANECLTKPLDFDRLENSVREYSSADGLTKQNFGGLR